MDFYLVYSVNIVDLNCVFSTYVVHRKVLSSRDISIMESLGMLRKTVMCLLLFSAVIKQEFQPLN